MLFPLFFFYFLVVIKSRAFSLKHIPSPSKKFLLKPSIVVHINPCPWEAEEDDHCESEASLRYTVSSKSHQTTQWEPDSKKKKKNNFPPPQPPKALRLQVCQYAELHTSLFDHRLPQAQVYKEQPKSLEIYGRE